MALYIPASRRRRRLIVVGAAALVVGLALGALGGRSTAPSLRGEVSAVQEQARTVSAQLRVLSLHQEAGATAGDAGAGLALRRARTDLADALARSPWISAARGKELLGLIDDLIGTSADPRSEQFTRAVESAAAEIDEAFGLSP